MRPWRRLRRFVRQRAYVHEGALYIRRQAPKQLFAAWGLREPFGAKARHGLRLYTTPLTRLRRFSKHRTPPGALVIREPYGRMGNQTIQLVHAHGVASRLGINRILAPGNQTLVSRDTTSGRLEWDPSPGLISSARLSDFFLRGLAKPGRAHLVGNPYHLPQLLTPLSREELSQGFAALRECASLSDSEKPLGPRHLVIHVRGGDAFGVHAHREYAQPPVSFYRLAITARKWTGATIVRADDSYPFENELTDELENAGIPWEIQSGTADEDAKYLARAQNLVSSRGSFIPAITGRSDHTRRLWVFGEEPRIRSGIEVYRVTDSEGTYWSSCCQSNWTDSPDQRRMMRDYPTENLTVTKEPT